MINKPYLCKTFVFGLAFLLLLPRSCKKCASRHAPACKHSTLLQESWFPVPRVGMGGPWALCMTLVAEPLYTQSLGAVRKLATEKMLSSVHARWQTTHLLRIHITIQIHDGARNHSWTRAISLGYVLTLNPNNASGLHGEVSVAEPRHRLSVKP